MPKLILLYVQDTVQSDEDTVPLKLFHIQCDKGLSSVAICQRAFVRVQVYCVE